MCWCTIPNSLPRTTDIPWQRPYEMRNALSHGYFNVDMERTWRTVENDVPTYNAQIEAAMAKIAHPS